MASRPATDLTGRKSIKASPQLSSIVLIFGISTGDQLDPVHRIAAFPVEFSHQPMDPPLDLWKSAIPGVVGSLNQPIADIEVMASPIDP
jgi:hypothetical protein